MPKIEEEIDESKKIEFDDDIDLPLPNTGLQGPLLQHVNDNISSASTSSVNQPPPPSTSTTSASNNHENIMKSMNMMGLPSDFAEDERIPLPVLIDTKSKPRMLPIHDEDELEQYKHWLTLYPIYFDAKASQNVRKLSRDKCVWWPLANDIAECAANLGYKTLFEPTKCHPQDWENPGRIKLSIEGNQLKSKAIRDIGQSLKHKLKDDTQLNSKRSNKLPSAPSTIQIRRPGWSPAKPAGMFLKSVREGPKIEAPAPQENESNSSKKDKKPKIKRKVMRVG